MKDLYTVLKKNIVDDDKDHVLKMWIQEVIMNLF